MASLRRCKHWYDDAEADSRVELLLYSQLNGHAAQHFADLACTCGKRAFHLYLDDTVRAAVRVCTSCGSEHPIGDSSEYLADAELLECMCPCGGDAFEITAGVSFYREDKLNVVWLYLGCRCPDCGLTACCGDWVTEFETYQELLARV
jgi:hypothetical protein